MTQGSVSFATQYLTTTHNMYNVFFFVPAQSAVLPKCGPVFNPLKPNDAYRGRTAPLTSKIAFYVFIQPIQVLNILNMVYTLRFFLFKMQFVS